MDTDKGSSGGCVSLAGVMCSEVLESRQHFQLKDVYSYSCTEEELILELKECDSHPPNIYSGNRL